MLIVYLGVTKRDPSMWNDPSNFDLARERSRHLAFGYAVHSCISAPAARLEVQGALQALVARWYAKSL